MHAGVVLHRHRECSRADCSQLQDLIATAHPIAAVAAVYPSLLRRRRMVTARLDLLEMGTRVMALVKEIVADIQTD